MRGNRGGVPTKKKHPSQRGRASWRWESVVSDLTPPPVKSSQMFLLSSSHLFFFFPGVFQLFASLWAPLPSFCPVCFTSFPCQMPSAPPMPCCIKLEQRTLFFFFFHNRVQFSRWACSLCLVCLALLLADLPPRPLSSWRLKRPHADARTIPPAPPSPSRPRWRRGSGTHSPLTDYFPNGI